MILPYGTGPTTPNIPPIADRALLLKAHPKAKPRPYAPVCYATRDALMQTIAKEATSKLDKQDTDIQKKLSGRRGRGRPPAARASRRKDTGKGQSP